MFTFSEICNEKYRKKTFKNLNDEKKYGFDHNDNNKANISKLNFEYLDFLPQ